MESTAKAQPGRIYDWQLLRWVWTFVRPYRRMLFAALVLMPLNSAFALAQPYLVKLTIDLFLSGTAHAPAPYFDPLLRLAGGHGLLMMGFCYLLMVAGEFTTFYGQYYLTMAVAQYSLSDLRIALFARLERLPLAFFDSTPVGRLVSRSTTDIDAINEMFNAGSLTILVDLLTLAGIVAIMFALNAHLALWSLCAIPPLLVIINLFRVRARALYREIRDRLAALNAYLSEALSGMAVIQLFTHEAESGREFELLNRRSRDIQRTANIYEAGLFSSVEALSSVTVALILWAGGGEVVRAMIGIGTLVAFIEYAQKFFFPLRDISTKYTVLQSALAATERIKDLMEEVPEAAGAPQRAAPRAALGSTRGEIVFDQVSFAYRPGEPVLRDISFIVEPGRKVAVVGATGSGKTTIIKLLARFYDVTSGRILVDGRDVRAWDLRELRRAIGLVQQDVMLFSGSVGDNLRMGRTGLDDRALMRALERSQALTFVRGLPHGLEEEVIERGANLSAGQRQLLAFARALAYDAPILVMDEATSSVDSETERLLQLALEELLADRTALVVAHRLSTIERADRILVLSKGILRESGTHRELLAQGGLYRRLFEVQYAPPGTGIAPSAA